MSDCTRCSAQKKQFFCSLGPEALARLESISTTVHYPSGATLFREGDPCGSVYLVCSGRIKLSVCSTGGKVLIMRVAETGAALGLSAALSEGVHELTAEAAEPCELKAIRREVLMEFMGQYREASVQAAKSVAQEYRQAFEGVCRLGLSSSPTGRLARLLLDWSGEDSNQPRCRISMPYTHEELASMTATSRETVTRTLSRFRKDNLISVKGISLTVLQPQALALLSAS